MLAEEFQTVRNDLFFWQAYSPAVKCDLSSSARLFGGSLVFIDPIPLAPEALEELVSLGLPAAVLLTSSNHARAAAEYRKRFSIPIIAHAAAATEFDFEVDLLVAEGDRPVDHLEVIELTGGAPGEIAYHAGNVLHVGDALIDFPPLGFSILPDKYCTNPGELRLSLGKLLRFNFELLTFAHGLPLATRAHQRLASLLA